MKWTQTSLRRAVRSRSLGTRVSADVARCHPPKVVLIIGAPGAGKTTVLEAVTDQLAACGVAHASLETEHLAQVYPRAELGLILQALPGVWQVLKDHGVERLVLTHTCQSTDDVALVVKALGEAAVSVIALQAPSAVLRERIRARGESQEMTDYLVEVASQAEHVGAASNPVSVVDTSVIELPDVVLQVLDVSGWTPDR